MHSHRAPWADSCLILAALLLLLVQPQPAESGLMHMCHFHQRRPHPNGLCGRRLPIVLAGLCHQFTQLMTDASSGKDVRKRDVDDQLPVTDDSAQRQPQTAALEEPAVEDDTAYGQHLESIVLDKKSALAYLDKRQARGDILCECCYNQCTVLELLQYCELPGV